jgi:hypothetical protein
MILTEKTTINSSVLVPLVSLIVAVSLMACQSSQDQSGNAITQPTAANNPAADGFNAENSDPAAIEIADLVMEAMGGRSAWDGTRYLAWDFFGARKLLWDKHTGNVRVEFPDGSVCLVNIIDGSGKVHKQGEEVINMDSLAKELEKAKHIWINDSYWLVMPFKLKDSGVTLKHLGMDETLEGTPSHVLELTFKEVGVTPQNRYLIYVDTTTNLVNQWAFYREAGQDSANFILPWGEYEQYGDILLSEYRGERSLSDVMVFDSLPKEVFTSFQAVDLSTLKTE